MKGSDSVLTKTVTLTVGRYNIMMMGEGGPASSVMTYSVYQNSSGTPAGSLIAELTLSEDTPITFTIDKVNKKTYCSINDVELMYVTFGNSMWDYSRNEFIFSSAGTIYINTDDSRVTLINGGEGIAGNINPYGQLIERVNTYLYDNDLTEYTYGCSGAVPAGGQTTPPGDAYIKVVKL